MPDVKHHIRKQSKKSNAQRDYKKNICRNILRHAIKSMLSSSVCNRYVVESLNLDDPTEFCNYYNQQSETITGFRTLKDHILASASDTAMTKTRKVAL
jgi:hypothetical protein